MTHIDFVVGFILVMSAVFFMIYFVSVSISNNMNYISEKNLDESSIFMEKYLFTASPLMIDANEVWIALDDTKSEVHTEEIVFSMEPAADVKMYDISWNQISSTYLQFPDSTQVSFMASFEPSERKIMRAVYVGESVQSIAYLSTENNVSFAGIAGKKIELFSADACSGASYESIQL